MSKSILLRVKLRRFLIFLPALISATGLIYQIAQRGQPNVRPHWLVLFVLISILVFGFTLLAYVEYRKRSYDPTLALKYQEIFDEMKLQRALAARTLSDEKSNLSNISERRDELSNIDDVLDFFEDIGFYMRGDQISPEVAHHHFYH